MNPLDWVEKLGKFQRIETDEMLEEIQARQDHPKRSSFIWNSQAQALYYEPSNHDWESSWCIRAKNNRFGRNEYDESGQPEQFSTGPWELVEISAYGYRVSPPIGETPQEFKDFQEALTALSQVGL